MPSTHRPDERLLETAYELFSARGVRDVGVDELVERAGVAKATLYRHFSSKDELILAFLQLREERWTIGWLMEEVRERGGKAPDALPPRQGAAELVPRHVHRRNSAAKRPPGETSTVRPSAADSA